MSVSRVPCGMLDEDDLDLAVWVGPGGIIGLIIVLVVWWCVHDNHEKCSERHCDKGLPVLMEHDCLCVEKAK